MTDTPADTPRGTHHTRSFLRRWVYPAVVILAIIGVIWWLETRNDGGVSSTGERYGGADLPAELLVPGVDVGTDPGDMAPDFLLQNMDGDEVRLSDFRGYPVVLNFWATWCAPCRKEMPQFVRAYDDDADDGLVIIGVDQQESESIIKPFIEDYGVEFPILIDRDGDVGIEFRITGYPETYFIDAGGIVREHFIGPLESSSGDGNVQGAIEQSELEQKIAQILPAENGNDGGG